VGRTDGPGAAAALAAWAPLAGAMVTTSCDLAKDSLPIVGRTLWHPSFDRVAGALPLSATALSAADQQHIAQALRRLGLGS
jgi:hypothetical protein